MTVREKLLEEFGCAISATFGDVENEEYAAEENVEKGDITEIARKVIWYLGL